MAARLGRLLVRSIALLMLAAPAAAQAPDTRAILNVILNGIDAGESIVIIRNKADGGRDVLVPAKLFEAGRLRVKPTETIDGAAFVSLSSVKSRSPFVLDEVALELRIDADATGFLANAIDLSPREPAGTVHTRNASAYANYALNWSAHSVAPAITGEIGASAGTAKFATTITRTQSGQIERGLTTVTYDQPHSMRRMQAGDIAARGVTLWSGSLIEGATIARDFGLNPYFVKVPSPKLSETITTPSTVDVYVNDRLVRRAELQPGVFDVTGVPAITGAGEARLVIRDAFGRSQELSTTYYITGSVLSRGLSDFQYSAGLRRANIFDPGRGNPALTATHRVGVTNAVTIGGHAEADRTLASGGLFVTAQAGRIGAVEFAAGASRQDGGARGGAITVAWSYTSRSFSASASVRVLSSSFVSFGDPRVQDSSRLEWSSAVSRSTRRFGALSLDVRQQWLAPSADASAGAWRRYFWVAGTRRVFGGPQLQWRVGRNWTADTRSFEASVGLSIGLGHRTMAMLTADHQQGRSSGDVMLSRPLSSTAGAGFRARVGLDGAPIDAAAQLQNRVARLEVQTIALDGTTTTGATLSGGVVTLGRSVKFTNAIGDSYGLVRVPGVKNVRVFSNNVEVGRTDSGGNLLIPALIPYYANRLAISDMDLPGDRSIADGEKMIAPPSGAGAVITFGAERIQAVAGSLTLRLPSGDITPDYGLLRLTIGTRVVESPVAAGGEFFLEQVPPGSYLADLLYHDAEYTVTIVVPVRAGAITNVGRLVAVEKK